MITDAQSAQFHRAALLGAAVQLRRSHGILYAMRFLQEYAFDERVIWEVLGLIPVEPCSALEPTLVPSVSSATVPHTQQQMTLWDFALSDHVADPALG